MFFKISLFSVLVASILVNSSEAIRDISHRQTSECNGSPALCDRTYGSVSFVGAHNSYAFGSTDNLFVNQDQNVTQQLNDGIRMLQMQAHNNDGTIQLCHSSCAFLDGGSLEEFLGIVKTWMDSNPNDVVTLLIVNIDNMPASNFDAVFQAAGLNTRSFVPESSPLPASAWPTLGSMISAGTTLVTFMDNGADPSIPYIIDEFTNVWETAFNVIDAGQLGSDCSVNRTNGDTTTQLYLINHFLDYLVLNQPAPLVSRANVTNSQTGEGSLGSQVESCTTLNGRAPNFLLVDFYEFGGGSVFQVAADINGVEYNPPTPVATPSSAASSGAATATSTSRPSNSGSTITTTSLFIVAIFTLVSGMCF